MDPFKDVSLKVFLKNGNGTLSGQFQARHALYDLAMRDNFCKS